MGTMSKIRSKRIFFLVLTLLLGVSGFFYGNYLTSTDLSLLSSLEAIGLDVSFPIENILISPDIIDRIQTSPRGRGLTTVVQVRDSGSSDNGGVWTGSNGYYWEHYDKDAIKIMLNNAVITLSGESSSQDAWFSIIPYISGEIISVKLNLNCGGTDSNTYDANPYMVEALAEVLNENLGVPINDIWFNDVSHPDPANGAGMRRFENYLSHNYYFGVFQGSDMHSLDYGGSSNPPDDNYLYFPTAYSDLGEGDPSAYIFHDTAGIENYIPYVFTQADHIINMALLKNHGSNHGGTFSLKNQGLGTPQIDWVKEERYGCLSRQSGDGDGCPQHAHTAQTCAAVNAHSELMSKTRLVLIDGIYGQMQMSSCGIPDTSWSSFGNEPASLILAGTDPVAVDSVANYLMEQEDIAAGTDMYYYGEAVGWIPCLIEAENLGVGIYESYDEIIANGFQDIDFLIFGETGDCIDGDGDGYGLPGDPSCPHGSEEDCDDDDPLEFPNQIWYKDEDGDGYSDGTNIVQCERYIGYFAASELSGISGDCDDNPLACGASCNPDQIEDCEDSTEYDEDCNGQANGNDPACLSCSIVNVSWRDVNDINTIISDIEEPGEVRLVFDSVGCIGNLVDLTINDYDENIQSGIQPLSIQLNIGSDRVNYIWDSEWVDDVGDSTSNINEYKIYAEVVSGGIFYESDYLYVNVDITDPLFWDHDDDYSEIDIVPFANSASFEWGASELVNYHLVVREGDLAGPIIFDESDYTTYQEIWQVTVIGLESETSYYYDLDLCDLRDNCVEGTDNFVTSQPLSTIVLNYTYLNDTYITNSNNHENDNYGEEDKLHLDGERGTARSNILMKWDMISLTGSQIESAELFLYTDDYSADGIQEYIEIYPMIQDQWTEGGATFVEWLYSGGQMINKWTGTDDYTGDSWTLLPSADYEDSAINRSLHADDDGFWHVFDITSLVQGWVDGSYNSDAGMVMFAPMSYNEGSPYYLFASSEYSDISFRPRIEIDLVVSNPDPCTLIGAYWEYDGSNDQADEGEVVELNVMGTDCAGEQISFDIREDDMLGGTDSWEDADLVDVEVYPITVTFAEGGTLDWATSTWTAEWHADDNGGVGDPEFIFRGELVSDSEKVMDSVDELSVNEIIQEYETYYVDDDNVAGPWDGSEVNPFQYIQNGVNILQAGDTLIIKNGTYYGHSVNQEILDTVNDGSAVAWITIKAEDDFGVILNGSNLVGQENLVALLDKHYYRLEGLIVLNSPSSNIYVDGTEYVKVLRCGSGDPGRLSPHANGIGIKDSNYTLIERCFAWGRSRYQIGVSSPKLDSDGPPDSFYNVFRGNLARLDYSESYEPKSSFTAYNQGHSYFFNNIAIDGRALVFPPTGSCTYDDPNGFRTPKGAKNTQLKGNIVLNHEGTGYLLEGGDWEGLVFENNIAWHLQRENAVTDCPLVYFYHGTDYLTDDDGTWYIGHGTYGGSKTGQGVAMTEHDPAYSRLTVLDSIFLEAEIDPPDGGVLDSDFLSDYNAFWNNTINYGSQGPGAHDWSEQNGNEFNITENDLLYLPRIEEGYTLDGNASDGGDVGATVLKQIGCSECLFNETGWNETTDIDLWPWYNEEVIEEFLCSYSNPEHPEVIGNRGFCLNDSLTEYIWGYLGNPCPVEFVENQGQSVEIMK